MRYPSLAALAGLLMMPTPVGAQARSAEVAGPYAPFEFLIGDWSSDAGGGARFRQSFRWGPERGYILYSTFVTEGDKPEHLHFEGIAVWNAKSRMLDYVFAVEPGSAVQEKGTIRAEANGLIVREVEFTGSDGRVGQFRQTFRRTGSDTAVTSLMRKTANGWEPNFPGSDQIVMTRRD